MQSRNISDNQITASSYRTETKHGIFYIYFPEYARLNSTFFTWSADDLNPWIQVDMLRQNTVTGIITQGGETATTAEWVTELQIQYGLSEDTLIYISENGRPIVRTNML